jgi:general secretion pathway protein C
MPARLSAFVIWALVSAGAVFWGYRLWATPLSAPANLQVVSEGPVARGDLTRLLGAAPVAVSAAPAVVAESSRFRLLGVLAPVPTGGAAKPSTAGVALIAVDGRPARAYAVGARLDGDLVLLSVARRSASIGPAQGEATVLLELPSLPAPATGSLPRPLAGGESFAVAVPPSVQAAPPQRALPVVPPAEDAGGDDEPIAPPRPALPSNAMKR